MYKDILPSFDFSPMITLILLSKSTCKNILPPLAFPCFADAYSKPCVVCLLDDLAVLICPCWASVFSSMKQRW